MRMTVQEHIESIKEEIHHLRNRSTAPLAHRRHMIQVLEKKMKELEKQKE